MPRKPAFTPFTGTVYRVTTYDVPVWASPNRRDGRWNVAYTGCTQYFCLDAEGPYAEMLRAENLQTEQEAATYSVVLWQLLVDEGAIVDYSSFEKAEAAGFPADALVDDDHARCRAEATRLQALGATGVLSPCAALPGSVNLTIFGPRVPIAWGERVTLASMIPHQRLARGSAPAGLVGRVRFYGTRHAGFESFRSGQKKLF